MVVLTPDQLRGLKKHKYKAEGKSILEYGLQHFWNWFVTLIPLWIAPNLLTFAGIVVNLVTCLAVIFTDPNGLGQSPRWLYLMAALGVFIYQTLDAIDGKQARRTRSNNSLGEIFDHGCDAISTLLVVLAGCSAGAINEFPYVTLTFVLLIEFTNYVYHWQTYVSGCLYFKTVDCTEGQVCHMTVMVLSFLFGTNTWEFQLPVIGIPFKFLIASGVIFFSITNIISSFIIIFTRGVGKNGATVADTSVVSPFIPPAIIIACSIYYSLFSPSMILQNHVMLLCSSMIMPFVKLILLMMMSGICASPLPLIDIVMIGPIIAVVNLLLGCLVPEYYVLIFITIFNVYDLVSYCVSVVNEVCNYLDVHCFTIPYPPPPSVTSSSTTPTNKH